MAGVTLCVRDTEDSHVMVSQGTYTCSQFIILQQSPRNNRGYIQYNEIFGPLVKRRTALSWSA